MNYKYVNDSNFEDYASGRVIYCKAGMPNFPVRLSQEIFLRCLHHLDRKDITLYDPCCGSAYMLTVLGLLNPHTIQGIVASDISEECMELAKSNLDLLTQTGLDNRKKQIERMFAEYNKDSHREALTSVNRFRDIIKQSVQIRTDVFHADILAPNALAGKGFTADIVMTDVPYGNLATWSGSHANEVEQLLDNLLPVLSEKAIVAVITDKSQKAGNEKYDRLEKIKAGKRQITLLRKKSPEDQPV